MKDRGRRPEQSDWSSRSGSSLRRRSRSPIPHRTQPTPAASSRCQRERSHGPPAQSLRPPSRSPMAARRPSPSQSYFRPAVEKKSSPCHGVVVEWWSLPGPCSPASAQADLTSRACSPLARGKMPPPTPRSRGALFRFTVPASAVAGAPSHREEADSTFIAADTAPSGPIPGGASAGRGCECVAELRKGARFERCICR